MRDQNGLIASANNRAKNRMREPAPAAFDLIEHANRRTHDRFAEIPGQRPYFFLCRSGTTVMVVAGRVTAIGEMGLPGTWLFFGFFASLLLRSCPLAMLLSLDLVNDSIEAGCRDGARTIARIACVRHQGATPYEDIPR